MPRQHFRLLGILVVLQYDSLKELESWKSRWLELVHFWSAITLSIERDCLPYSYGPATARTEPNQKAMGDAAPTPCPMMGTNHHEEEPKGGMTNSGSLVVVGCVYSWGRSTVKLKVGCTAKALPITSTISPALRDC